MTLANDYSLLDQAVRERLGRNWQMQVGGVWCNSASGRLMDITDPTNGEIVARVPRGDKSDVHEAVMAARRALETGPWPRMRPFERERIMLRLADLIEERAEILAQTETLNSGKLIGNTRIIDVEFSAHTLRYMAGWASKLPGKTFELSVPYAPMDRFVGETRHGPVGVVAAIMPWNVPLCQAVWKLAPVLATGCTIVLKPAEPTPLTTLMLAALCAEVGVPEGVVNVVTGDGAEVGASLVTHPGVDKINFTGSTGVGRTIAAAAAPQMKKMNLELGGKSAVVIWDDADLDRAIPGAAWAIFGNHGQNCCAGSRLFVHESIFDKVMDGVVAIAESLQIGPGLDPATQLGPLVNHAHRDKVAGYVSRGVAEGGALLTGGKAIADPGAYIAPAIIIPNDDSSCVVQEEIFGPVLVASRFSTLDDLLPRVDGTEFGLGASIWSNGTERIEQFVDLAKAGTVWINNHNTLDVAMPFGGWKQSGIGHELGEEGVRSHLTTKAVIRHRSLRA